jgi:Porin subfamily
MKMAKRLLLGSAAGLIAVGGAQSAELPVKAAPVQYVKICTLYGEGFYYIPGSDTCLRLGGYVRAEYGWNLVGARTPAYCGTQGAQDRTVSQLSTRNRLAVQMDTRTQTQYGTLRTFTSLFMQSEDQVFSFTAQRAFIQWLGFTFGHAQSFQDTWAITDAYHLAQQQNNSDTGANGINQIAYTMELGNGMTLTAGADEVRRKSLLNFANTAALRVDAEPSNSFRGQDWPDTHLDFKVNQAWGYYALTGVVHDVAATYYNCRSGTPASNAVLTDCNYPKDRVGWAIETGAEIKLDFIAPGDHGGFMLRYAQGASQFGGGGSLGSAGLFASGYQVGIGWITDGVFFGTLPGSLLPTACTPGVCKDVQIQLTTTWTVGGAYEHYWTPQLKTAISGAYTQIQYNDTAKSLWADAVCTPPPAASPLTQANVHGIASEFCDPDWAFFQGGVRTQWSPVPGFYFAIDTGLVHVFTAFKGATAALTPNPIIGARPAGTYFIKDEQSYYGVFRAQRQFNAGD